MPQTTDEPKTPEEEMVSYIQQSAGGDFAPTPEGQHVMVCCRVVDLGTQTTEFQGETKRQRKVLIGWQIPEHRVTVDGQDMPILHQAKYTWSFHEKANLRKDLESWRGRKFTEEDFAGPPHGFHIRNLIGVPCLAQIVHETGGNGKTYANLSAIMKFPGKKEDWPLVEGEPVFFDLDAFDAEAFGKLSEYWQGVIKQSPEYQEKFLQATEGYSQKQPAQRHDLDDEIPF